jgi:hypothetical protein
MSAVIAYRAEGSGLVCACLPQVAIIADMVPEPVLRAKLDALGVGEPDWVAADEYRAAHRSAIVGSIDSLSEQVDTIEDATYRAELAGKIEELRLHADRLGEQQQTIIDQQAESNALKAKSVALLEQQQRRIEADRAAKAQAENAAHWIDVQVVQGADGSVEMLKHFVKFVAFVGPKREPEFERYAVRLGSWASAELAPADVRARIGKPFARSKPEVPKR